MIPDSVWLSKHRTSAGDYWMASSKRLVDSDIPYRRDDQECVWRWNESLESWQTGCHRMTMDVDDMWVGCPWCRNRIEVEEV